MKPYYEHGGIQIYHADCRDVLPSLPKADLVLTDPPYGIFACGGKWGKKADLQWDKKPASEIEKVIAKGSESIVWGGNYFPLPPSRGWLIWWKRDRVQSAADVEMAWTSRDMNSRLIDHPIAATNAERCGHPTQKPLRVIRWCLTFFPDAKTIIDPYMGSGTTLRVAKDSGLEAIGIEIEERYCEIAAKRLQQEVFNFD